MTSNNEEKDAVQSDIIKRTTAEAQGLRQEIKQLSDANSRLE